MGHIKNEVSLICFALSLGHNIGWLQLWPQPIPGDFPVQAFVTRLSGKRSMWPFWRGFASSARKLKSSSQPPSTSFMQPWRACVMQQQAINFLLCPAKARIRYRNILPDKKMLAIGRSRGKVLLWDMQTNKVLETFHASNSRINAIAYSAKNHMSVTDSKERL